ncbi:hypothetical protein GCM10010401_09720 [Rarobacter faecitabidus]|uniref:Carboxypeptidase family protein n=1 Tax=Rarobacter faecitabidus TaxID=13243 RepID=A0A542ZA42_RARFA|nr:nidogen-like domain-containing protein [Rarobacter faecitabidus]TQL57202.1 carboxypeptidase family protein [Rarobacter faecitabidus]
MKHRKSLGRLRRRIAALSAFSLVVGLVAAAPTSAIADEAASTIAGSVVLPSGVDFDIDDLSVSAAHLVTEDEGSWWEEASWTGVASDGSFAFEDLDSGTEYLLRFWDGSGLLATGYYQAPAVPGVGSLVRDDASATRVTSPASGIVFATEKSTALAGPLDLRGVAAPADLDIKITAYQRVEYEDWSDWESISSTSVTDDDTWRVGQLTAGDEYALYIYDYSGQLGEGGYYVAPSTPGAVGSLTYDAEDATLFTAPGENITLSLQGVTAASASGVIRGANSAPIENASASALKWDPWDEVWENVNRTAVTEADGTYVIQALSEGIYTVRGIAPGFTAGYLGNAGLPAAPTATNSFEVTSADDVIALSPITLQPRASALGTRAGIQPVYGGGGVHTLPATDDGSSEEVQLPFPVTFFGQNYTSLYVNNNGNVTFGDSQSQYTPDDLQGRAGNPIIAPFFADVDTRGEESGSVTYGASADGKKFYVTWDGVGFYSRHDELLNTFQLVLTSAADQTGRSPGDFDITFNYDRVEWETGDASDGENGFGGTSAAAGYSAGLEGVPGTFVQLPGSFTNGALVDGGSHALTGSSQNSTQAGRYQFEIRNADVDIRYGDVTGTVTKPAGSGTAPAVGTTVRLSGPGGALFVTTDENGEFNFSAVRTGAYRLSVIPTEANLVGSSQSVTVREGSNDPVSLALRGPHALPSAVSLVSGGSPVSTNSDGVPVVYYGDPINFGVNGTAGATSATYQVTLNGNVIRSGALTENPAGRYSAVIPALYPNTGDGEISYTLTYPGGSVVTNSFDIYIDPSGVVVDQYGNPVAGATVTVLRAEAADGDFEVIPDGSTLLAPVNRNNPSVTGADGRFHWDVVAGWYKLRVERAGSATITTPAWQVAPERVDLVLELNVPAAVKPVPSISGIGAPVVGATLDATRASWPSGIGTVKQKSVTWFVGGVQAATGNKFVVPVSAVGKAVSVQIGADRVIVGNADGTPATSKDFAFDVSTGQLAIGTALKAAAPRNTGLPQISGAASFGSTLRASSGKWTGAAIAYTYQWQRAGKPIAGAVGIAYKVAQADIGKAITVKVTATSPGSLSGTATSKSITATKGKAKITVKAPKKVKAKKGTTVAVKIAVPGIAKPTGSLVVKWGNRTIKAKVAAGAKGSVKVKLPALKRGTAKLTVKFAPSGATKAVAAGGNAKAKKVKVG